MAIKPPSDIILEVSQAANPEKLRVATAKLQKLGETANTQFANVMEKVEGAKPKVEKALDQVKTHLASARQSPSSYEPSMPFDVNRARLKMRNDTAATTRVADAGPAGADRRTKAMQDFEAMVLQNFIGSMLPQNAEQVYGEGTAGDIWKSMLAEQLGKQMARSGGIGIADRLLNKDAQIPDRQPSVSQPAQLAAMYANISRF